MPPVRAAKTELRREMRAKLAAWTEDARRAAGIVATLRLLNTDEFRDARTVFAFVSYGDELDTRPLLRAVLEDPDKRLCVPRIATPDAPMEAVVIESLEQLSPGTFGIEAPPADLPAIDPSSTEVDFVVVPALAFDGRGARLGKGQGYYDRFFADHGSGSLRIGLGGELQYVETVPSERHDVRLHGLVTEKTFREFSTDRG